MTKLLLLTAIAAAVFALSCAEPEKKKDVAVNSPVTTSAPATTPVVGHQDAAPRISLAEAKKHFDEKTAVFIDTHPPDQFEAEHIPGAINIQPNIIKQSLNKSRKERR